MNLSAFFEPTDPPQVDPFAQRWLELRERAVESKLTFQRPREGYSFGPAELIAEFTSADGDTEPMDRPWTYSFDRDLINGVFPVNSIENEGQRLGYGLKFRLEPVEIRYGDGFYNAVLVQTLAESDLSSRPGAAELFNAVQQPRPYEGGRAYDDCTKQILDVVSELANDITTLGYKGSDATDVLSEALLYYLKDRFYLW